MKEEKEFPAFQWSKFNEDRSEQYVVRSNDFDDFSQKVQSVRNLGKAVPNVAAEATKKEIDDTFCSMHSTVMKLREYGLTHWYDHRKKEGEVWMACKGTGFEPQK